VVKAPAGSCRSGYKEHIATLVDDRRGRCVFFENRAFERGADLFVRGLGPALEHALRVGRGPRSARGTAVREGKFDRRPIDRLFAAEDSIPLVSGLEQFGAAGDALGRTEEQEAAGAKRVVEERHELLLEIGAEIDEDIPAGNEIELRKGRIADEAVLGEDAHLAQLFDRLEVGGSPGTGRRVADEEACEAFGRYLVGDFRRVATMSCLGQHRGVEVSREDLHESSRFEAIEVLAQQDGDGVSLLARGTTRDPDANGCVGGLALHDEGNSLLSQGLKRFRIAEELGHADQ